MSLVKKLKDILFEEEDEETEPVKTRENVKKEEPIEETPKIVKIETPKEEKTDNVKNLNSERDLFKRESSFTFPDFDEEEFATNMTSLNPKRENVLDHERKISSSVRPDKSRYERVETREKEVIDKKKFRPSPIISPVYGILNQDYKAEDIVNRKDYASNINIEEVRKKAFEAKEEKYEDKIDEPVVTFFEEKENEKVKEKQKKKDYKTIDDILEEAADEIDLEDTLEIPSTNNLDAIEEELEKIDVEEKETEKEEDLDDTLDNDLFELIDSMYDEREDNE